LFIIVIMRSPTDDRTARAVIRDETLRLFAERNSDAVTVRDIAAAAGVSPALVLRHYGSKDGLRAAVDEHVMSVFADLLAEIGARDASADAAGDAAGLAARLSRGLPQNSPIPGYLARLLVAGGDAGSALFARLFELSRQLLGELVTSGAADDGGDPDMRAAVLLANDLGVILLRPLLAAVLGVDPLSPAGLRRWTRQVLALYDGGLTAPAPGGAR
jgi:AcrR family transcriptional regulator